MMPTQLTLSTLFSAILFFSTNLALACDDAKTLTQLRGVTAEKLLQNAPTFRHGWEDGSIQLRFLNAQKTAGSCQARLQMTLPQQDIDEVNAELNAQPAKRILLGAQGYAVPEQPISEVDFFYTLENGNVVPKNADNVPLKSLYSSIEYMYQSLAQSRIVLANNTANNKPWRAEDLDATNTACTTGFNLSTSAESNLSQACACRTQKLTQLLTSRQMELVLFVQSQPYSAATGVLKTFIAASKPINESCQLVSKQ